MPVTLFPFSAFIPDGSAYGRELERFENVLPIHRGARSLRQKQAVASVADGPMLGAHVHIYQASTAEQHARPDADTTAGIWLPNTGTTLYTQIDEQVPSDGDYIYCSGAPTAEVVKIALSDIVTPAAGTQNAKWRYRIKDTTGAWTLKLELVEGTTVRGTVTVNGSGDTAYVDRTDAIVPAVTSWANLFLQFTATVAGAATYLRPASDSSVGTWTTNAGGATSLYAAIDETSASDADFVQSPILGPGQSASYTVNLGTSAQLWVAKDHKVRYRYRGANAGMSLTVTLLQGTTTIASWSHASIATTYATATQTLTSGERDAIRAGGYTTLKLKFDASYPTSVASTVGTYARPDSEIENSSAYPWVPSGAASNWEAVDEVSPSDSEATEVIRSAAGFPASLHTLVLGLSDLSDPLASDGHVLRVRWKSLDTVATNGDVRLLQGGSEILPTGGGDFIDTSFTTQERTLTAAQANAITNYADLRVELQSSSEFVGHYSTSWIELEVPMPRRLEVSFAEMELPSAARAEVTYAEYVTPATDTSYRGDLPTIYCGSRTKLYEVDAAAFDDISAAAGYGAAGSDPASWSFASWGNHVIATNIVNPVQWREDSAGDFKDLISSATKPKARFCAAARSHLMLGGINEVLANHHVDEVYWSAFEDIEDFEPAVATQCDYQRLVSTPGQIMGLVGGDDVLVWKRRSIYRLMWVGGALVWQPDVLSGSVGTPYPRSIVQGQGEVYFWGGESFYRLPRAPGAVPEPLGKGILSRLLTDTDYSDAAVRQATPGSMKEEDQVMIGAWCAHSGLVVWSYQGKEDSGWQHTRAVIYNPDEDRWSIWSLPDRVVEDQAFAAINMAALFSQPNTINDDTHELKGLLGLDFDGTNSRWFRFDGGGIYESTLRTKTFPIAMEQDGRPRLIRLKGVLPIFTGGATGSGSYPDIAITVESAIDPRRVIGYQSDRYVASASADQRQWLPFDLEGYFFRIEVVIPPATGKAMRTFDGVYLDWETRGS